MKYADFSLCHRYYRSRNIYGLIRFRAYRQGDADIFANNKQID